MLLKTLLRSLLYQSEKFAQRTRFALLPEPKEGWPILLGISFPKSGTHLLDQVLLGFNRVAPFSLRLHSFYAEYEGASGRKRAPHQAVDWLESLRPGDVVSAHLFARPEVVARVCTPAFLPYFIFRDPRDVVVSHTFYVSEMEPNHVHHAYYHSLPDFNTRLAVSILGRPDAAIEFPDIAGRFSPYLPWLDQDAVMKIHFEELVLDRAVALDAIIDHFLARVPLSLDRSGLVSVLESSINPQRSPTFRAGRTGDWKRYFTDEHREMFKRVAGDLLVKLGYESNADW